MSSSGKKLGWLIAGFCLLLSARAFAAGVDKNPCVNDIDCAATPDCGGSVCSYLVTPHVCVPAGSSAKGSDGWCDSTHGDNDCKCKAQGAKCNIVYCTFTKASDAPAGTGGASGGGTGGKSGGTDGGTSGGSSGGCALAGGAPGALGLIGGLGLMALAIGRARRRR